MTFLNPLALLGLAAASIPLIVHLFNFRRPRQVDFSSLAFLKELEQRTMQRMKLKQWLLLLLRTLAIACMVLAFARPTLTGEMAGALGGRAPASLAIVVDNSLSMTLRDAQGEYLEQAKKVTTGLINEMKSSDEVFLLTTADTSETASHAYGNRTAALDALNGVRLRPGAQTSDRALARAATLLEEQGMHPNRALHLVSDLQRSTLTDTVEVAAPGEMSAVIIPVGGRQHANVGVTNVEVKSRIVEVGQPVRVEATLTNYGQEPLSGYTASLYIDDARVAQASADLSPGAPTRVTFTATPQERGWLAGRVELEDDAFPPDNERHFTLHVPEQRRVLIVRGRGQSLQYLNTALSPELTEGRAAFAVNTVSENQLAATALSGYDAVALVGPTALSSGEVAALSRYVKRGGGLLFFPSGAAAPSEYNALLTALGAGQVSGFSGSVGGEQPVASFERVDVEHPLFEGVFEQDGSSGGAQVERPDLYRVMNYRSSGRREQTLIELSNGFPFLQEMRHGEGAALLFAVAPDPTWSDLPVRGLFVPLLYRAVYYLSASGTTSGAQFRVGEPASLRLTGVPEASTLRLVGPEGESFTPEQRNLFGAVLLHLSDAARPPGLYDVRAGDQLVRRVAYNLPARESDLATWDPGEAADRLQEATGLDTEVLDIAEGDAARIREALTRQRRGMELWNVFLLAAIGFLVAEMVVARRWKPEAAPA